MQQVQDRPRGLVRAVAGLFRGPSQRDFYEGFSDANTGAFELVLTPMIFAGIGLLVAQFVGSPPDPAPSCFGAFGLSGTVFRALTDYKAAHGQGGGGQAVETVTEPSSARSCSTWPSRGLLVSPVLVAIGAVFWGVNGALSVLFALGVVLINFAASAAVVRKSATLPQSFIMMFVLGGFVVRMLFVLGAITARRPLQLGKQGAPRAHRSS